MKLITKFDWISACVMAVAFCALSMQYVPALDDFTYSYNSATGEWATTIKDVIQSNCYDYCHVNGRFILHVIVQTLCVFNLVHHFAVANGLFFGLLCLGSVCVVRLLIGKQGKYQILLIATLLFLLIPGIGHSLLGIIPFAVNYLWASAFYVWFLFLYLSLNGKYNYSKAGLCLLCLFAFICGQLQESFAIGIAGLIAVDLCINRENIKKTQVLFSLFFALGFMVLLLAPGNWQRVGDLGTGATMSVVLKKLLSITKFKIAAVFLTCLIVFLSCFFKKGREFLGVTYYLWIPAIISLLFSQFVAFTGLHQLTSIGILCSILIVCVVDDTLPERSMLYGKLLSISCFVLILLILIPSYCYRSEFLKINKKMDSDVLNAHDTILISSDLEMFDRVKMARNPYRRFLNFDYVSLNYSTLNFHKEYVRYLHKKRDCSETGNHKMTRIALPQDVSDIISICCETNAVGDNVYYNEEFQYLVAVVPDSLRPSGMEYVVRYEPYSAVTKLQNKLLGKDCTSRKMPFSSDWDGFAEMNRYFCFEGERYILFNAPLKGKVLDAVVLINK